MNIFEKSRIILQKASHLIENAAIRPLSRKVSTQIDNQQASSVGIHPATFEVASWQKSVLSPREAWIESLKAENNEEKKIQLLNPTVFAHYPRIDILFKNVRWQKLYKHVSYANAPVRHEISRSLKKPWPQKGMGRARHGDRRSPIWIGGAKAHGPRGPKTYYHELSFMVRLKGLLTALSMKLAQDDLHIVENLDINVDDPKAFEDVLDSRLWGPSVLFVDDTDFMPERISLVTDKIPHYNLMPVYGLNVYSMLKHTTLVLTVDAVKRIEERMLYHLNRTNMPNV